MSFLERLRARAGAAPRRIVFPEGDDPRVLEAVALLAGRKLARPMVIGGGAVRETLARRGAVGVETMMPREHPRFDAMAARLHQRRAARGMALDQARDAAARPLLFAALIVGAGEADGSVAGAANTTSDVLRAALWGVGPAPGIETISSAFYMRVPCFRGGTEAEEEVLTFTDAGVVLEPSAAQLAEIAAAAADARRRIVGDEPKVAFLSYSTRGSAEGASVDKVRGALAIFRTRFPSVAADGELQADAALIPDVATRKAPGSEVAGRANVLVFPDLDAANIAYKLVQRLAGADALGPIVQGLARPCNDLSRGACVSDIVDVACITALMAHAPAARG